MEKGKSLFVNDGSFMERFKQLQEGNGKGSTKSPPTVSGVPIPKHVTSKTGSVSKVSDSRKPTTNASGGKLAFSLKQKSKLVAPPVKLDEDDEEERDDGYSSGNGSTKRQKVGQSDAPVQPTKRVDVGNYFLYTLIYLIIDLGVDCGRYVVYDETMKFRCNDTRCLLSF